MRIVSSGSSHTSRSSLRTTLAGTFTGFLLLQKTAHGITMHLSTGTGQDLVLTYLGTSRPRLAYSWLKKDADEPALEPERGGRGIIPFRSPSSSHVDVGQPTLHEETQHGLVLHLTHVTQVISVTVNQLTREHSYIPTS